MRDGGSRGGIDGFWSWRDRMWMPTEREAHRVVVGDDVFATVSNLEAMYAILDDKDRPYYEDKLAA